MLSTPTSSATVLRKEGLQRVMCRTVAMFALALILGIVNWVLLGLPLLPTISDTWTKAPASYVSRYIIGTCCLLFQVANVVVYRANQDTGKFAKASWVNKLCLFLSMTAVFALSWIGAVCDSESDSCRGNNNVHMLFAYTFFFGYNMYMVILTVRAHKQLTARQRLTLWGAVLFTLATKLRAIPVDITSSASDAAWFPPAVNASMVAAVGGDNLVAVVEWVDVTFIMVWTLGYLSHRTQAFGIATVQLAAGAGRNGARIVARPSAWSDSTQVLNRVSGFTLATAASALLLLLLVATFVVEVFVTGAVPLPAVLGGNASWPQESALWDSAPGNWLARWALVCAAVLLLSYNSLAARTLPSKAPKGITCLAMLGGYLGCLGMALSGCVDSYEDADEHAIFLNVAFCGLNVYALLISGVQAACEKRRRLVFIAVIVGICGTLFRCFMDDSTAAVAFVDNAADANATDADDSDDASSSTSVAASSVAALLQWLNTILLLLFVVFYTATKLAAFEKLGMAIVYTVPGSLLATRRRAAAIAAVAVDKHDVPVVGKGAAGHAAVAVTYAQLPKAEGNGDDHGTYVTARLVADDE